MYRIPHHAKVRYSHEKPLAWIISTPTPGKLCSPLTFICDNYPGAWHQRVRYHGDTVCLHKLTGAVTINNLKKRLEGNPDADPV